MHTTTSKKVLVVLLSGSLCAFSASALAPKLTRVALVIGNSAYKTVGALVNPANDAKAMSQTLRGLGFEVVELRDANVAQMNSALATVKEGLNGKQGVGLFYFAGHGMQLNDQNYIIPVDAAINKSSDVPKQALNVAAVVDAFKSAGNSLNIVVLDACRNNPFGSSADVKGLAPMDAPVGTFLAYATAPGNVAEDGDEKSGNGLYTHFLLQEIKKPQARIEDVFKRVRFNVRQKSEGRQIPWETTSMEDDFSFDDGTLIKIKPSSSEALQQSFIEEGKLWNLIKNSKNVGDFYAFVQKYPNGTITEAAHARINVLSKTNLKVQGAGADGKPLLYTVKKFRLGDEYVMTGTIRTITLASLKEDVSRSEFVYKVININGDEIAISAASRGSSESTTIFANSAGATVGVQNSKTGMLRFDPPQFAVPDGLLQINSKWPIAYSAGKNIVTGQGKVVAKERVTVPAGTFDTFKVQKEFAFGSSCFHWIASDLSFPIKKECTTATENMIANGRTMKTLEELTRFVRGT